VLAGTRQIYGRAERLPVDENQLLAPPDINAVHKIAAENYMAVFARAYGLAGTCLRLTNTYGPGMRIKDARQMFLGIWIRCLIEDEPFEVWGRDILRDFTYVDDCVDAFLRAAVSDAAVGRTYNLGADAPITLGDLADLLVAVNGGGRCVVREFPEERRGIDIGDFHADWSRIGAELGWRPAVPLEEGLRRTLDWYRRHAADYL
jgi:UDP-glucose 4-epimerase